VTASVLHDVTAAVWTGVPSNCAEYLPRIPYKSFVCGLDSGDEAEMILRTAAAFAKSFHARLSLVNVVETSEELQFTPYKQDLLDKAEDLLRELKRKVGVDVPHAVIDALTPAGIRQEAIRRNADLLILGRGRAQDKVSRIWSQLYAIVRKSPCPVLSLPIRKGMRVA
jgi:nucleotide-binding universal stress UspA family protein